MREDWRSTPALLLLLHLGYEGERMFMRRVKSLVNIQQVPTFRLYRTYVSNYNNAVSLVEGLDQPCIDFVQVCFPTTCNMLSNIAQEQLAKHPDAPQDLLALLALPTTQLNRYKLLLQVCVITQGVDRQGV